MTIPWADVANSDKNKVCFMPGWVCDRTLFFSDSLNQVGSVGLKHHEGLFPLCTTDAIFRFLAQNYGGRPTIRF